MMMVKIKKNCCSRFLEKYVLPENFVVKIKKTDLWTSFI